eukprot:TRINITY_DN10595_c1_g1_i4.p1 TRINITY_DN10595_c1_g1~~TRINITY_DN10595_c1_g1_i4.p1  ORF type:complete len:189 (-),score=33.98 TRINITY_DN10595_c1_g1_i4:222-788(-)
MGVMERHPLLLDFLFGKLHDSCNFTVPFFPLRREGQSDLEYKCLVMKFKKVDVDGQTDAEPLNNYAERMGCYLRLYAALLVTPRRGSRDQVVYPYIDQAWCWLINFIPLKPKLYSASIMSVFLDVTNYFMWQRFSNQYMKLRNWIHMTWLPTLPTNNNFATSSKSLLNLNITKLFETQSQPPAGSQLR